MPLLVDRMRHVRALLSLAYLLFLQLVKGLRVIQFCLINKGNRTEWSPVRSIIIRMINKIGLTLRARPI